MLMLKMKDYQSFFKSCAANFVLVIPTFTVLLPTLLGIPIAVPLMLIPPHLFYLFMFVVAIIIELRFVLLRSVTMATHKTSKMGKG